MYFISLDYNLETVKMVNVMFCVFHHTQKYTYTLYRACMMGTDYWHSITLWGPHKITYLYAISDDRQAKIKLPSPLLEKLVWRMLSTTVGQTPLEVGASPGQIPTHQPKIEGEKQNKFHK